MFYIKIGLFLVITLDIIFVLFYKYLFNEVYYEKFFEAKYSCDNYTFGIWSYFSLWRLSGYTKQSRYC